MSSGVAVLSLGFMLLPVVALAQGAAADTPP